MNSQTTQKDNHYNYINSKASIIVFSKGHRIEYKERSKIFAKGDWKVFSRYANYNVRTQTLSVGCRNHSKSFLLSIKDGLKGYEEKTVPVIVKKSENKPKVLKTNVFKEESDTYYISSSGKTFAKSIHHVADAKAKLPFSKRKRGDKTEYNVGTNSGWGSEVWRTESAIVKEVSKILEVIEFIEQNQVS